MKTRNRPLLTLSAFFALLAAGCVSSSDTDPADSTSGIPEKHFKSGTYAVAGDSLVFHQVEQLSTACFGDSLRTETHDAGVFSEAFELEGNQLRIVDMPGTQPSGAVTRWMETYTRIGNGSGIDGVWQWSDIQLHVVSGSPTDSELADEKQFLDEDRAMHADAIIRITLDKGHFEINSWVRLAERYARDWKNGEAYDLDVPPTDFSIEVKALDASTLELKGLRTGETVRRTLSFEGDDTYTSDNPAHAAHVYHHAPAACPNPSQPLWYGDFLEANKK